MSVRQEKNKAQGNTPKSPARPGTKTRNDEGRGKSQKGRAAEKETGSAGKPPALTMAAATGRNPGGMKMTTEEIKGLKQGLEIRKREAELFIEKNINTEYWKGVVDVCKSTLVYLENCNAS